MSTLTVHPYALRTRTGKAEAIIASVAASTSEQDVQDRNSPSPVSRRLFSDVVIGQNTPALRGGHEIIENASDEGETFEDLDATRGSDDQEDHTPDQNLNRWTADNPNLIRRTRSFSNTGGINNPKIDGTTRQRAEARMDLVAAAAERLSAAQRNTIERRYKNLANVNDSQRSPSATPVGEGPSHLKGKTIDPSNWGNLDLDEDDLDPKAQHAALRSLKQKVSRKKAEKIKEPKVGTSRHIVGRATSAQPKEGVTHVVRNMDSRPIRQIPFDSYISQTLNNIHRLRTGKR